MSNPTSENILNAYENAEVKIKLTIEVNDVELAYHPEIVAQADDWYEQLGQNLARKIDDSINDEMTEQVINEEPADYDSIVKYGDWS